MKTGSLFGVLQSIAIGNIKAIGSSPQLSPGNVQTKVLEYSQVSAIADENWAKCRLYIGDISQVWGFCAIFPSQNVVSAGWYKA